MTPEGKRRWAPALALTPLLALLLGNDPAMGALFLGLAAPAAVGLTRRSVRAQVFAQGVVCFLLVEGAEIAVDGISYSPLYFLQGLAMMLASGLALALAWPSLGSSEARASFAPVAYREWFLVGAIACVAATLESFWQSMLAQIFNDPFNHWTLLCWGLSATFLAGAWGILRMRAWGVLLGGLSALVALAAAAYSGMASATVFAMAAAPALALGFPLAASRWRARPPRSQPVRVSAAAASVASPREVERAEDEVPDGEEPSSMRRHAR